MVPTPGLDQGGPFLELGGACRAVGLGGEEGWEGVGEGELEGWGGGCCCSSCCACHFGGG